MKTWEAIKKLTENPEKQFIDTYGNILKIYKSEVYEGLKCFNKDGNEVFISVKDSWKEVKQPVTWKEAFEAGLEGKKIKVEGQNLTYSNYEDLTYAIRYLAQRPNYYQDLMKTNWYIED